MEMKRNPRYKTLRDVRKLGIIEEFFKNQKARAGDTFHKTLKKFLNNLQTILVYQKHARALEPAQIIPQLKEDPFKDFLSSALLSAALVDLYEYVQSLYFPNIRDLLAEPYKQQSIPQLAEKSFQDMLIMMKEAVGFNGVSLFDYFKPALYRFVYRKVLTQSVRPEELLS